MKTTSDLADTVELANGCACEEPGSHTLFSFNDHAHLSTGKGCILPSPCQWSPPAALQAAASRTSSSAPLSSCCPWRTRMAPRMTGETKHACSLCYCCQVHACHAAQRAHQAAHAHVLPLAHTDWLPLANAFSPCSASCTVQGNVKPMTNLCMLPVQVRAGEQRRGGAAEHPRQVLRGHCGGAPPHAAPLPGHPRHRR